jgi:hypothetical protein
VAAAGRLHELDRAACRAAAERRFSVAAMADRYERVYRRLLVARDGARHALDAPMHDGVVSALDAGALIRLSPPGGQATLPG